MQKGTILLLLLTDESSPSPAANLKIKAEGRCVSGYEKSKQRCLWGEAITKVHSSQMTKQRLAIQLIARVDLTQEIAILPVLSPKPKLTTRLCHFLRCFPSSEVKICFCLMLWKTGHLLCNPIVCKLVLQVAASTLVTA